MNNGGPAFPESFQDKDPRNQGWIGGGMTLRDYFAAKAMQQLMPSVQIEDGKTISKIAYQVADAMIKAREV